MRSKLVDGAGSAQEKDFRYRYDATQGNKNVKLVQITDPRGNDTDLAYYTAPVDPQNNWKLQAVTDRLDAVTGYDYVDPEANGATWRVTTRRATRPCSPAWRRARWSRGWRSGRWCSCRWLSGAGCCPGTGLSDSF